MKINTLCLLLVFSAFLVTGCKSKSESDAPNMAANIQNMVKKNSPGTVATSPTGYMMTAKIDGKDWKADAIYPPDRAGQIVGENNGESIALPYYDRKNFLAKKITKLKGIDMRLNDKIVLYTGTMGEMELTKVDDNMAEGKFYFTASGFQSDKIVEVTDGFFRIVWK